MLKLRNLKNTLLRKILSLYKLKEINLYNLRHPPQFILSSVHSVYNATKFVPYSGSKIWEITSLEIKNFHSFASFKLKIKTWKSSNFPCRHCKSYIQNIVFFKKQLYFVFQASCIDKLILDKFCSLFIFLVACLALFVYNFLNHRFRLLTLISFHFMKYNFLIQIQ